MELGDRKMEPWEADWIPCTINRSKFDVLWSVLDAVLSRLEILFWRPCPP